MRRTRFRIEAASIPLAALLLTLPPATPGHSHSELERSEPKAGAGVRLAPTEVALTERSLADAMADGLISITLFKTIDGLSHVTVAVQPCIPRRKCLGFPPKGLSAQPNRLHVSAGIEAAAGEPR